MGHSRPCADTCLPALVRQPAGISRCPGNLAVLNPCCACGLMPASLGRMRRALIISVLVSQLVACAAPKSWQKEGATEQAFQADSYECERDARQSGYFGTGGVASLNMQGFFARCLQAHGYHLASADDPVAQSTADARSAAGDRCESKGFRPPSREYAQCFDAEYHGPPDR